MPPRIQVLGFSTAVALCLAASVAAQETAQKARPEPEVSEDVRAHLASWADSLRDVRSLRVTFEQTKHLRILRRPRKSAGVALVKGHRVLLRTTDSSGRRVTELAVDRGEVRIHYPRLKRLEIYPATESAGTRSPFPMVVEDVEKLPRDYRLKLVSEKTDKVLVMKPRDADSPFTEVRIRFRDGRIAGVEQKDRRGNRVVLEITEFDVDAEISDDDIELSVPSGTKVVRFGETAADRATGSPREKGKNYDALTAR